MTTANAADKRSVWALIREGDLVLLSDRELLAVGSALVLVVAACLWLLFTYIEPPPPSRISITTGTESGAYFAYGKKYAEQFKKHGIDLEVLPSRGSGENLSRLSDPRSGVTIGLTQSGIDDAAKWPQVESLASVAYEPIWIFYRPRSSSASWTTVEQLRDKRVAIGPEGSGTRVAALKLLQANGIGDGQATLSDQTGGDAVQMLMNGELDAAVIVAAADAPSVAQALASGLEPISFARADAYVRLMPWLSKIVLPRGVVNLSKDLPREDTVLVAPSASLVVRKDLHPAITYLLMEVAADIHRAPTITSSLGEFPSEKSLDFAQSNESKRFFKNGRPFLQRYLPFWVANLLERLALTLLPILALVIPAVQYLPRLLNWRGRARILRLYDELKRLDREGELTTTHRASAIAHLDRIETSLGDMKISVGYYIDFYNLKSHLDMLRARVA